MFDGKQLFSIKIQVGGLSEGVHQYHFEARGEELALGPEFLEAVEIDARLEKTGSQISLRASLQAEGTFTCDRCLTVFKQRLQPAYTMVYVLDEADAERYDPSEVQVISPSLGIIDVTEDVRQTLLLAVPLKLLCQDSCKGLCPHCGKNWNLGPCDCHDEVSDTRWDQLKKLRTQN
jgi:uncharacterized protein